LSHLAAKQEELVNEMITLAYKVFLSYFASFLNMPKNLTASGQQLYFQSEGRRAADFYHA
jgi:hypothetical protein